MLSLDVGGWNTIAFQFDMAAARTAPLSKERSRLRERRDHFLGEN